MPALLRARLEQLMTHDQELQKLAKEHSEYEAQLRQLAKSPYLNLEDLQREVTLKKLKLRVKDAIRSISPSLSRIHPPAIRKLS
jgi:uncharacterized protein YdcH (DUF465 family)